MSDSHPTFPLHRDRTVVIRLAGGNCRNPTSLSPDVLCFEPHGMVLGSWRERETSRVHHASWRCGGGLAARGARAAAVTSPPSAAIEIPKRGDDERTLGPTHVGSR